MLNSKKNSFYSIAPHLIKGLDVPPDSKHRTTEDAHQP
jgi:hypothetical protein